MGRITIQQYGHVTHAAIVTVVTVIIVGAALRYIVAEDLQPVAQKERYSMPRNPAVYLTGIIALFSMMPEGAVLDWAALYLQQELGSEIAVAGLAFAAFSAAMAIVRFLGDGVRNRFGAVTTLRGSSLIAATGMLAAGFAPNAWVAIAAFALSGIGIANMVPIAFSAAGNHKGVASGAGLSTVTLMGYSGILVAPSAIGFVGERTGFAPVFVALSLLLVTGL
jgi:fucose permease